MSGNPERPMKMHVDSFVMKITQKIEVCTEIRIMIKELISRIVVNLSLSKFFLSTFRQQ